MSITIENEEAEALLSELTALTRRSEPDLLLDLLQRERERIEREMSEAVASGRTLHERWTARPITDPRPVDDVLAYDENGLPA
ncbi:type II toxin-antitoxin system VapB family antitoxin [Methylobacterium soli]|jgi:hypothetical protein|uniref:PSK operon transcription factor n=1 Tax=Methylobacterium soli TaxID=553447 RepID=A0A6L3SVM4_9HYPH|nr:type II toxin-antitoxin system VapB family antitoxin [Methylobacterium soli]KAB1077794.1 hypothetical protein F6X53_17720 [Methylobacterium soli]GJE45470.1 hypothetical protein AEGHOMDF_4665 [Methylobacterium soli]